jgi:hypothetical protein
MDFSQINYWAVFAAAFSTFLLGGLWYSPLLFYKAWMRANNFTEKDVKRGNQAVIFGFSFIFSLFMALNLAMFLADEKTDLAWGVTAGFLAGFGWAALSLAIVSLFERRSWSYIFINGGYLVAAFILMGAILGGWR